MNFFYCEKDGCKKGSCTVCNKELPRATVAYDDDDEEMKTIEDSVCVHFKCWELKELKARMDSILD